MEIRHAIGRRGNGRAFDWGRFTALLALLPAMLPAVAAHPSRAADGLYTITMGCAVEGGKPLTVVAGSGDGAFDQSWATQAEDNLAHWADASALKRIGGAL
jgi:hypothetical protein